MNTILQISRRRMLAGITSACGAAFFDQSLLPGVAWAQEAIDPRVARIVADTISVDMHNHVGQGTFAKTPADRKPDALGVDLSGQMKKSGLSAVCLTYAVDGYRAGQPGDWYQFHIQTLDLIDRLLSASDMKRSLTMADLQAAHKAQKPTVIQDSEGAQWIEGHLERVEEAYKRGLRHLQLVHQMHDLVAPLADVQQLIQPPNGPKSPAITGLTEMGARVIRECNRLGIVVDMAHATEAAVLLALKVSTQPITVTHTALDTPTARLDRQYKGNPGLLARLVSRNCAKSVADAGGVVGVWHIFPTMKDFVTGIKEMVDAAGVDHVGIGTDTSIAPGARGAAGAPPPPGALPPAPMPGGTNGIWPDQHAGFVYAVAAEMLAQGFHPEEISKIAGGNYCRVFEKVTHGHA